jgi:hypothetical protein
MGQGIVASSRGKIPRVLFVGLCLVAPLGAQEGTVRGTVVDSAGVPIGRADVSIIALRRLTRTDDSGRFAFPNVPHGTVELSVRRLAYNPVKVSATLSDSLSAPLRVALRLNPALLEGVNVVGSDKRRREQVEEFYRRAAQGVGTYFTRDDVEQRSSGAPSDLLRAMAGVRFVRVPSGRGVRFPTTSIGRRDCAPLIWLDGQRAPGMEIDDVPLSDIEGIELYHGPSTTPLQFTSGAAVGCGTIAIWSRPPTRRPRT